MKTILNLIYIVIATITLYACTAEHAIGEPVLQDTKGMMAINIITGDVQVDEYVYSARFIVFDNVSTYPTVDINQMVILDKNNVWSFNTYLKVRHNQDKALIVILNEPDALTRTLESVSSPYDLNTIKFQMADIFNQNHTVIGTKGIPMTGIVHNISITESHANENSALAQELRVERAVARVDIWFKTYPWFEAAVTENTKITLSRSYDEGYLVGPDIFFGSDMQTVIPNKEVVWQHTGVPLNIGYEAKRYCSFYTPERTCDAANHNDKLILTIEGIDTEEGQRRAVTTLLDFTDMTNLEPLTMREVRRNYVYKTIANIHREKIEFYTTISPWTNVKQDVIIDPQYFLTVSEDNLYLPNYQDRADVIAITNYDHSDRNYPDGICIGETRYYTKTGEPVTDTNSLLYGWLHVALDEKEGYLRREIEYSNMQEIKIPEHNGCYAIAEVKAGNLTKLIRINR
ncbi:hypothetical protein DW083_12805 [Parabacteroides sp. AF48-14]|uniref:hypothetical protein n=1 Tax=Parabacteroides sp. AF48-14 TaxID=2292052 RepID=UPI000EFF8CFD|nr:hypothetical protein [Parabacteroides sp. AF48-14]RHO70703.1 hypothetical protein DW083_12805 [Parabacteroides sp. AF48-14]